MYNIYVPDVEETKWGEPNALFIREFVSKAVNYVPMGVKSELAHPAPVLG
jgi:hypothetical protein